MWIDRLHVLVSDVEILNEILEHATQLAAEKLQRYSQRAADVSISRVNLLAASATAPNPTFLDVMQAYDLVMERRGLFAGHNKYYNVVLALSKLPMPSWRERLEHFIWVRRCHLYLRRCIRI